MHTNCTFTCVFERVTETNLGCDVEVLVLLQQLLRVVNAGTSGSVCGQIKLPSVMNPLQSLRTHRAGAIITRDDSVCVRVLLHIPHSEDHNGLLGE